MESITFEQHEVDDMHHHSASDDVGPEAEIAEIEVDDEALEAASGGQQMNSTEIIYASTFVPFDSSF